MVVIAALAYDNWLAREIGAASRGFGIGTQTAWFPFVGQFMVFLEEITTLMGIGFLVLVATEAMLGDTPHSKAVVLGRVAGAAVVIAALAYGIKFAGDSGGDQFWVFLVVVTTPMGIGFLVLALAEAIKRRGPRYSGIAETS